MHKWIFGLRAARCRFPYRKLACGSFFPQALLRESPPPPRSVFALLPCNHECQPASSAGAKAAASCTLSKASLRMPMGKRLLT